MEYTRRQICTSLGTAVGAAFAFGSCSALMPSRLGRAFDDGTPEGRFLHAVTTGDIEAVKATLSKQPELATCRDEAGRSALVLAFLHGHVAVGETLRDTGITLDIVEAVMAEDWQRFERLAADDPGALTRAHPIGGTPLHAVALMGKSVGWRVRGAGCAPNATPRGGSGFSPPRTAMAAANANWARVALCDLCGNGSDINHPQKGGSSVLHGAVRYRDADLVRLAIRKGAAVDAVDTRGLTARDIAASIGWHEGARMLAQHASLPRDNRSSRFALDANRQPVIRPDLSDVPQQLQSETTGNSHNNLARVRELVSRDPRLVHALSTDDELPIEAAAHIGQHAIMRFHLDRGSPLSLPTAVSLADHDSVRFWLDRDPSLVHERGAHDFPLMFFVVFGGTLETAELLQARGVPVDQDSIGTTALHWCVIRRRHDLAKWLLDHGANPHAVGYRQSRDGVTPLQMAEARSDRKMVTLLKDAATMR